MISLARALFLGAILLLQGLCLTAQPLRMRPADRLMVEFIGDHWRNVPENMRQDIINRGFALQVIHDMPLGRSRFSVAAGMAFYSHNLYTDHFYQLTNWGGASARFDFVPIPQEYTKNKLNLNYLGLPFELRYRGPDRERGLRLYAGISADYLVSANTKFRGLDRAGNREIKVKEHLPGQINPFRIQAYARIGIGKWAVIARLPLSKVFEDNSAREMVPVSLGLNWSLY
jgi:hypothetical protein